MSYHENDDSGSIDLDLVGEDVHDMLQDIFNDSQVNVVEVDDEEEKPPLTLEEIDALASDGIVFEADITGISTIASSNITQPSRNKHILADSAIDDIDLSINDDGTPYENMDSLDFDSIDFEGGGVQLQTTSNKPPTLPEDEEEYNYMNINGDIKIDDDEEDFNALGELVEFDPSEKKHQYIDEAIMTLLQPDYFKEMEMHVKLNYVRNYNPVVKHWPAKLITEEIIDIASKMSLVDCVSMYDAIGDENLKTKESYKLKECDLSEIKVVPKKYLHNRTESGMLAPMDEKEDDDAAFHILRSQTLMKDGAKVFKGGVDFGSKIGSKIGKTALSSLGKNEKRAAKINCSGCGNRLKFNVKKRHKHHFMGYKCAKTKREYIFHDYVCVKLRRIKESIRTYVLNKEKEENPNMQIDEIESALISLDFDGNVKSDLRTRPIHSTTPRRGDFNYIQEEEDIENSEQSSTNANSEFELGIISSASYYNRSSLLNIDSRRNIKTLMQNSEVKHLPFRKYRSQVQRVSIRMDAKRVYKNVPSYCERFIDLPEVLLYSDLSEFGVAIWEFVSESMKSKVRDCLWTVLEWLALEMPTNQVLSLLKLHTHLLSKHTLIDYDKICKSTIEGSKYPIACTLRLSAFMYERSKSDLSNKMAFEKKGKQYVNVARKLLKEIESDHLFALLLMVPTDLGHQNVIDIALKHDLTEFLQDPRIVRIFKVISFNGYDFLDPRNSFQEPDITVDELFDRLWQNPGRFYFSPFGKFCNQSALYIIYLALFSYVTYKKIYNYEAADNIEVVLWLCSLGYVMSEVLEIVDTKQEYFSQMSNYIDIFISLIWIGLAYLKFVHTTNLVFDDTGSIDQVATRNLRPTEIYMALWGIMAILLWTRGVLLIYVCLPLFY